MIIKPELLSQLGQTNPSLNLTLDKSLLEKKSIPEKILFEALIRYQESIILTISFTVFL